MFERGSSIVKDESKLSFDYVPKVLIHREKQMQLLETFMRPAAMDNRGCGAYLSGKVGTGKTATVTRFCEDMVEYCSGIGRKVRYTIVNCRIHNTEYSAMLEIVHSVDRSYRSKGFTSSDMFNAFRTNIEKEAISMVVVLDEADVLFKNESKNLVYQLMRVNSQLRYSSVSLILISQTPITNYLDEASLSTFKKANRIQFDKYTRDELREIILARCKEALVTDAIGSDEIDLLADIAGDHGDARFAIEMIDNSAHIAESSGHPCIMADDIRIANSMIYSFVSEDKLRDLDINHLLVLLAVARCIKDQSYVLSAAVEKTYLIVCEEYDYPSKKHTQFGIYINDLVKVGLINSELRSTPEATRATHISLPGVPAREMARKIEMILEDPGSTQ